MTSAVGTARFSIVAVVGMLWVSAAILGQCEATTVSLTAGPYSNSRRHAFLSRDQSRARNKVSASILDDDVDSDFYNKVEECSVCLLHCVKAIFHISCKIFA